jgi:predicted ATP-binding protein involved in virulence
MRLQKLKLSNFRGFRSFEITFDPAFTVLLGGNMAGKTAVLDGAAAALSALLEKFSNVASRTIRDHEVHQVVAELGGVPDLRPQFPVAAEAHITAGRIEQTTLSARSSPPQHEDIAPFVVHELLGYRVTHGPVFTLESKYLPVIAQYGTHRTWSQEWPQEPHGVGSRFDAYADCFEIESTYPRLAGWMKKQTLVQLQRGSGYVQPQLSAVEAAVRSCIGGIARVWFDIQYDEVRLQRTAGDIQSFTMLSDGVRNMLAMVSDIAWRAAVLNPEHGAEAHLHTTGIVLIDEIDLHLHPAWQRRVIADLHRTFPQIQFIVTTHSPQIVASVKRSQIRMLDQNRLVADEPHVEGRDTNAILEDVFGVPSRSEALQAEIDTLYRLIEDGDFAGARAQLDTLLTRLGPDDVAMVRARWILDMGS